MRLALACRLASCTMSPKYCRPLLCILGCWCRSGPGIQAPPSHYLPHRCCCCDSDVRKKRKAMLKPSSGPHPGHLSDKEIWRRPTSASEVTSRRLRQQRRIASGRNSRGVQVSAVCCSSSKHQGAPLRRIRIMGQTSLGLLACSGDAPGTETSQQTS